MELLDNLPPLNVFKPKISRTLKTLLCVAAIAFPTFGTWMVSHMIARRQALLLSGANAAGAYLSSGLVRSMDALKLAPAVAVPAPARTAPAVDDSHCPLILTVPSGARRGR